MEVLCSSNLVWKKGGGWQRKRKEKTFPWETGGLRERFKEREKEKV